MLGRGPRVPSLLLLLLLSLGPDRLPARVNSIWDWIFEGWGEVLWEEPPTLRSSPTVRLLP